MRALLLLSLGLLASACAPPPVPAGTVLFRFSVSDQVKSSPNLHDPLLGTVYGGLFLQEDVAVDGPRKDAVGQGDVEVAEVDLRVEKSSAASFVSPQLAPGKYVFLGFFDVDGSGGGDPEAGDPVTLALTNKFDITDGVETRRAIVFELVFN